MHEQQLSPEESECLKSLILEHSNLSSDALILEFIENPVTDVVNCRVEVPSLSVRLALVERYNGIAIGRSVYFSIPRDAMKKTRGGRVVTGASGRTRASPPRSIRKRAPPAGDDREP